MPLAVQFFRNDVGHNPAREFLDSLDAKPRAKVLRTLQFVEQAQIAHSGVLKKLSGRDNLWEVRVEFAGIAYRFLGFVHKGQLILVNAFSKKTRATPPREMALAEQRKRRYFEMNGWL